ncbi:MAG TPA: hypothetical protein VF533_07535 [Solirubrobacteraceae bacterium]|jgi:hypothetical protein
MKLRVALGAVALLVVLVGVAVAGPGGASSDGATVAWSGAPQVYKPPTLPRDRVMAGRVRNTSLRDVDLAVADIRLLDADGHPVRSTARFLAAYARGLYPPTQRPKTPNPNEQRQLGEIVTIRPNQTAPLTVSWRVPPGGKPPVLVDLGRGRPSLRIP